MFALLPLVASVLVSGPAPLQRHHGAPTRVSESSLPVPGSIAQKPGGGLYFVDPNAGGRAEEVRIAEVSWGRLVDVHGLAAGGQVSQAPLFRDFVIDENVQSDGVNYRLERHPVSQRERLVILRRTGPGLFQLLRQASENLPPLPTKGPNSPPPFGVVPRNATLVLRLDDLMRDGPMASASLQQTVRVFTGQPAQTPFSARIRFDPNHGGHSHEAFHSTRVLVDMTVSEVEAAQHPLPLPINLLGLPAGLGSTSLADVLLSIPTRLDATLGVFSLLTNLAGRPLASTGNGPTLPSSPTLDVVRAARAGGPQDLNNGFLLDLVSPEVLGTWPVVVAAAGLREHRVHADLSFSSPCRAPLSPGDVLMVSGHLLEVLRGGEGPNATGQVFDVVLEPITDEPPSASAFLGAGQLILAYDENIAVEGACWVQFTPGAATPPSAGVSPSGQVSVRFSEPIAPETIRPADTLRIVRGDSSTAVSAPTLVVADALASSELDRWTLVPQLPLAHATATADPYHVQVDPDHGAEAARLCAVITDLAGNPLVAAPPAIDFTLDPAAPEEKNRGLVMRFGEPDELPPFGLPDLRGQFFYDLTCGDIRPRAALHFSVPADRNQPVLGLMIPFPSGTQSPLSPLGSKVQGVWRYADLGWQVQDETKFNLDVEGLNWSPRGGNVVADFFPEFEIRLSHAAQLPDEDIDMFLLPKRPLSGLKDAPNPFSANVLNDPNGPQKVVHPRSAGYQISPTNLFQSALGTTLIPYPLNKVGAPYASYTWRDTAVLSEGGENSAGIPQDIEGGAPLLIVPQSAVGSVAGPGEVPSFGLPLLMEFRCYPSSTSIGLNGLDVSLAINSSIRPNFRAFSTGGVDTNGFAIPKNPDLEQIPSGGFNPASNPPGLPTRFSADNVVYMGQLDVVTRVSRVHTAWIDTGLAQPSFLAPLIEGTRPGTSQIVIEFRGASGFNPVSPDPFDASKLDPYGDPAGVTVSYTGGTPDWTSDITTLDGSRFVQMRFALLNDVVRGESPRLDTVGLAFLDD